MRPRAALGEAARGTGTAAAIACARRACATLAILIGPRPARARRASTDTRRAAVDALVDAAGGASNATKARQADERTRIHDADVTALARRRAAGRSPEMP
jgi:hypothetical protein